LGTFPQDHRIVQPARRPSARPASLTAFVAARTLDAELAALVWLTVDAHLPLLVARPDEPSCAAELLGAFLDLLPRSATRLQLRGDDESFDWIGDAAALGWPGPEPAGAADGFRLQIARALALPPRRIAPPETTFLLAGEIGPSPPADTHGARARVTVRALQRGYGLGAVIRAGSLEQVFARLGEPPASIGSDELRRLGIVLVLRPVESAPRGGRDDRPEDPPGWRVAACHYVRPLERDAAGHLQRRPPAILASWDPARDAFEHFAWGVTAELALRVGRPRDEFELEHAARTRLVTSLVEAGRTSRDDLISAVSHRSRQPRGGEA